MSYETRMYLRMARPWMLAGLITFLVTWAASALADLPLAMGASFLPIADLPLVIACTGGAVTAGLAIRYVYRLWQWQQGNGDQCMVCGCLLGSEYRARWNWGRRCLGCWKFVQTQ